MTTMNGSDSFSVNFATSFITSVDLGREEEALSFFCTSERRPTSGPPTLAIPNHTSTTTSAPRRTIHRDHQAPQLCVSWLAGSACHQSA